MFNSAHVNIIVSIKLDHGTYWSLFFSMVSKCSIVFLPVCVIKQLINVIQLYKAAIMLANRDLLERIKVGKATIK